MERKALLGLLDEGELFEVLDHDHPEFRWYISLDDEVAHEHDAAIDQLVRDLKTAPGVTAVVREDREVILVGGEADAAALEAWVAGWWRHRVG